MLARLVKLAIGLVILGSFIIVFSFMSAPVLLIVLVFFIMRKVRRNKSHNEYALPIRDFIQTNENSYNRIHGSP